MIERIVEASARHRGLVLLGAAIALGGAVWSLQHVQLDALPDLSDTQVIVATEWMGRSPTLIEDQVTHPIVTALVGAPRVEEARGFSMFGMSFVYVIFEEGTDPYWARSRVAEYLSGIEARLPEGVRPALGPDASGTGWILQYVLEDRSGRRGLDELRALQDFTLRYALGSVPGVAEVASLGGHQRQYQITVDPARLRAYGLTLSQVIAAVRDSNDEVGGRVLELSGREYYVRGRGYVGERADLESIALGLRGPSGTPVLLRDVATISLGPELRRGLLDFDGEGEAVGGIVVMRHGENATAVIERVKEKLAELAPTLPEGVEVTLAYDRSELVRRAIDTLLRALTEEALTVSLVIIVFLLHLRSALLPILSLPLAVALAFIPMVLLDVPATILSLGGIAIALGATVDAELVMIEAAHKKLEDAPPGADRAHLLAQAAREVTPAIFFSLLIIAVSFLPVFALNGQAGRLFRPLAYTKTFVMLLSALLSITFAPALRDLLIRGRILPERRHPLSRLILRIYRPFVHVALARPRSTLAIGLFLLLSALPVARRLGHEFMPPLDEGDILYMPITFPGISIEEAKRQLQLQDRLLRSLPEVRSVFGKVGRAETATDPAPLTMVETTVRLRPRAEWRRVPRPRWWSGWAPEPLHGPLARLWPDTRPLTWDELTRELDARLALPGWTRAWTMPIKARVDMLSTGIRTPVGVKVKGSDLHQIERIGTRLEEVLAKVPGTRSVLYERNLGGLYLDIIPDRAALARHGLLVGDVLREVEAAIGGAPISTVLDGPRRFSINVRYPRELRDDLEALSRVLVPVRRGGGAMAPSGPGMGKQGSLFTRTERPILLAQAMPGMPDDDRGRAATGPRPAGMARPRVLSDAPMLDLSDETAADGALPAGRARRGADVADEAPTYVPLGQLARIELVEGPPMVRDEDGALAGYVYVDLDTEARDLGGYVDDARARVDAAIASGELVLPRGYFLEWTGQYELWAEMKTRMKVVIPLTLLLVLLLLYLQFRSLIEALIVLLSVPFALVGSVWLLWLLDYRLSTAVWVGVIALVGLAAQTGVVMIVYIDQAFARRKQAGQIQGLEDIIQAHLEGTVLRVRPKLMTVGTMLFGLVPLLWADGAGADVMKRIAAPMVGGLITSAFLTLELIPVIYTYWRYEELLFERLEALDPRRRRTLATLAHALGAATAAAALAALLPLYVAEAERWAYLASGGLLTLSCGLAAGYLAARRPALRAAWPRAA
jgi:Cu(I)/Ag(I) efflux system membrane protein CusA/SilA